MGRLPRDTAAAPRMEMPRHTTITWTEYAELQRDRDILDWVAADFDRHVKPGSPGLRRIVGDLLESGANLGQSIQEAVRSFATRRTDRSGQS